LLDRGRGVVAAPQRRLGLLADDLALQAYLVEGERMVDDVARRLAHRVEHRAERGVVARLAGLPADEARARGDGQQEAAHDEKETAAHIGTGYGERHCPTLTQYFDEK